MTHAILEKGSRNADRTENSKSSQWCWGGGRATCHGGGKEGLPTARKRHKKSGKSLMKERG